MKKNIDHGDSTRAHFHTCTNSSENTSLAAISEFASAILSIEAPPLLTEADSLCFFYLPVGFVKGKEIRERERGARLNQEEPWYTLIDTQRVYLRNSCIGNTSNKNSALNASYDKSVII